MRHVQASFAVPAGGGAIRYVYLVLESIFVLLYMRLYEIVVVQL